MKPNYKVLLLLLLIPFAACKKDDLSDNKCIDAEGYEYKTVKIGNQVWMAENLRTTKFRNGEDIPLVTDNTGWMAAVSPAYCEYGNNPVNGATYGRMYNKYTLTDKRNIAPKGWHIPTKEEFETLINYLGVDSAGSKLKEELTYHWRNPGGNNKSGYKGLPGGVKWVSWYEGITDFTYIWTKSTGTYTTDYDMPQPGIFGMSLYNNSTKAGFRVLEDRWYPGAYIRCIKD